MLTLNAIRTQKEEIITRLAKRGKDRSDIINEVISIDEAKRSIQTQLENNLAKANTLAKEIGDLFKSGDKELAETKRNESTELKEETKSLEAKLAELEGQLTQKLYEIPNAPSHAVKTGITPEENETVFEWGTEPILPENPKPHWELTEKYDIIDFELGNKITGAGFPVYKGKGARLQRALINFFLDEAIKAGYYEIQPPILVNEASGFGTGQLPDKEGQMYHDKTDNLYLIPTAEVPITNIYRDVILKEEELPIKNVGYTPCFRREAGSYGVHVRGLNRLHQFDKVEIVQIAKPEQSYAILEEMVNHVKGLMEKLGLKYRILRLCGGDMGFASALTYDFEAWSGAQQRWLEVSSTSNFETFQANRLKCRYKTKEGKNELVHTLNGSALALPRIVACLLENYQTTEGIKLPECLHPYLGFKSI
ncbi:MAG: serine--tRNA ligase [Bacteroidetes bacterium]|nr:serine--tRNA ligase [Bacteroidota bacterium]